MELEVDINDLRKRKVFVATPMYGGMCTGGYTKSSVDLQKLAAGYQLDFRFFYLYNESLITRARNYLCDEFLRSDCTHLMFIDADIQFDPNDVITLLALADPGSDKNIICGPYPKKCISWEKIKRAVDKGFADKDPGQLERYVGDYVFNPAQGSSSVPLGEPLEVLEGGTGFMMIQREAFEVFNEKYPWLMYRPDHVRTDHFDGSREIMAYFDALIDDKNSMLLPELRKFFEKYPDAPAADVLEFVEDKRISVDGHTFSNRYLSEDYMFCQWVRKAGLKVWLCPWMKMSHMGSYSFGGSLVDLAQLGVAATADVHALGKAKKLAGKIAIEAPPVTK